MNRLIPRRPTPNLEVPTVGGGLWRLADQQPQNFTLIVVYRGFHCPICKGYLKELANLQSDFATRGISIFALSTDTQERAEQTLQQWELGNLPLGYGLNIDGARAWGLYVSSSRGKTSSGIEEPELFVEPGVFLIRPDGTLYASAINTMPFARPHFKGHARRPRLHHQEQLPCPG